VIANGVTVLRLLLIAPTAVGFARPDLVLPSVLLTCIAVAILTDYFDGVLARRLGTASPAGTLLDHAADFLFVTAALAGAAYAGLVTPLLPLLISVAFIQYVLDSRFVHRGSSLYPSRIGRWNGILYFVPIVILAAARLDAFEALRGPLVDAARWITWVLVASTLISIVNRATVTLRARTGIGRE
jgi:phosphatidylglycerophosphate synthase